MGQHAFRHNKLLYSDTPNKGFSSAINIPALNSQVQAYRLYNNSDDLSISPLDISQPESDWTKGILWQYTSPGHSANPLLLTANYLSGRDLSGQDLSGQAGKESPPAQHAGKSGSLALDTWLHQGKLHIYSEVAHSQTGVNKQQDHQQAYHSIVRYRPYHKGQQSSDQSPWTIGLETQRIEPNFFSAFYRQLHHDIDRDRLFSHYQQHSWTVDYSLEQQQNNLAAQQAITTKSQHSYFSVQHTRPQAYSQASHWQWLGRPSYQLKHHYQHHLISDTATATENRTRENHLTLGANFLYPRGNWKIELERHHWLNANQPSDNKRSNNIHLNTELKLNSQHKLLSTSRFQEVLHAEKLISTAYTLTLEKPLRPQNSDYKALLSIGEENQALSLTEQQKKHTLAGSLNYPLLSPGIYFSGMDIQLTGNYEKIISEQQEKIKQDYGLTIDLHLRLNRGK